MDWTRRDAEFKIQANVAADGLVCACSKRASPNRLRSEQSGMPSARKRKQRSELTDEHGVNMDN
jgi:hypothetical protein